MCFDNKCQHLLKDFRFIESELAMLVTLLLKHKADDNFKVFTRMVLLD